MKIIQKEIMVKSFLRNINVLNLILLFTIIALFYYVYWFFVPVAVNVSVPEPKNNSSNKIELPEDFLLSSPMEYTIVSENNLFHPERRIPEKANKEQKPSEKPDLVLYGTLITNNVKIAYMENLKNPQSSPGRGKRQIALTKGDKISGYTLKTINADKVIMTRGADEIVVSLFDPDRPVRSTSTVSKSSKSKDAQKRVTSRKGPRLRRNPAQRNIKRRLPARR